MAQTDVQDAIREWLNWKEEGDVVSWGWSLDFPERLERLARRLYERGALDQATKHLDAKRGILQALKKDGNDG